MTKPVKPQAGFKNEKKILCAFVKSQNAVDIATAAGALPHLRKH